MAVVDDQGLVTIQDISGKTAVMVRFQGKVSVFSIAVPLGAPIEQLPPSKNFIDDLVFANLKELGIPRLRSATTRRFSGECRWISLGVCRRRRGHTIPQQH